MSIYHWHQRTHRSKKPKVTAAVGLIPNWRDRVPEPKTLGKDVSELIEAGEALGGLADVDAEANPPSEYSQGAPTFHPKAKSGQQPSNVSDNHPTMGVVPDTLITGENSNQRG